MHWVHCTLCRLHTKFEKKIFSQKCIGQLNGEIQKKRSFLDEIKINPHVGSIKVTLKSNVVRHDLM